MGSFDFKDDPFPRIKEEMDILQGQYFKLEVDTRGASKLLGDCKAGNICKELKKLKQEDKSMMQTHNTTLRLQVADLKMELKAKDEEIRLLRAQT